MWAPGSGCEFVKWHDGMHDGIGLRGRFSVVRLCSVRKSIANTWYAKLKLAAMDLVVDEGHEIRGKPLG